MSIDELSLEYRAAVVFYGDPDRWPGNLRRAFDDAPAEIVGELLRYAPAGPWGSAPPEDVLRLIVESGSAPYGELSE